MAEFDDNTTPGLESPSDLGQNPQAVVRRWLLELRLADKRERDWRKTAKDIISIYTGAGRKKNSFNILWSNTETLMPAVYSSVPKPDVRRRYKDADPLGKVVSEVMNRALAFSLDCYDFDSVARADVLDMLLVGRGISRVRYIPSLTEVGDAAQEAAEDPEHEALEGQAEEVAWEQTQAEHVQWDDFRHGTGKQWTDVSWVAFRHRLTRDDLARKFGEEMAQKVSLDAVADDDVSNLKEQDAEPFKTAEVWEIWDKDSKQVLFIAPSYKAEPLKSVPDPLELAGFFPCPKPLYAIEDTDSLVPIPLFEQYKEQADELNRISTRINRIIAALKVRGVYDANISELAEVMRGDDNDLIPAQNVAALLERGGLEKAIWMLPVEQLIKVLQALYQQREAAKQTIYEITGMGDILRGASNPNETATAQQIKSQWGSIRIKNIQRDIARYLRDLIRLKAEIISQKFAQSTLEQMTLIQLQPAMPAGQPQQQMGFNPGQLPQPQTQQPQTPTWDAVMQVLRSDMSRTYRVDVETDSTVADSLESDMTGLREVLTGVVQFIQGIGPAVQVGAMPIEAVKEIVMAVVRRARMGNAVEDALDKMQAPQQQGDPKQAQQLQQQIQQLQQQLQQAQQAAQGKQQELQAHMGIEQMKMQAEAQAEAAKQQREAQAEQARLDREALMAQQQIEFDRWKAELDAQTKIIVAQIAAKTKLDMASEQREQAIEGTDGISG